MKKFLKEIINIDIKLTNYKPILKKYVLALSINIFIFALIFLLFWNTELRFILLFPIIILLWFTISSIIRIINISKEKGHKFFKSIAHEFKQIRISRKLKLRFYYLKYNFLLKCGSFLYEVLRLLMRISIPFLFICITVSKISIDFFNSFTDQDVKNLFDISTMIFGIVITLFSILVSTKQHKIYDENEHKLVLRYRIGAYSVLELIINNILYFVFVIINFIFGSRNALPIIFLIIYGLFAIISLTIVINSSIVKIYHNVNNLGKINIFQRRKGNFVNFLSKSEKLADKIDYIINLYQSPSFLEFSMHIGKLSKKVFYSQNQMENFDIELFKKYTIEYFKQIKNDSQILGLFIYIDETKKLLEILYEKEEYQFFEQIVYLVHEQLLKFLNSKTMTRRFGIASQEECKMSIFYDQLVLSIYFRNLLVIETIFQNVNKLIGFISDSIAKDETKFYHLKNNIYNDIQSKIIFKLDSYKSNNSLLINTITEVTNDFNKMVKDVKEKIKNNV